MGDRRVVFATNIRYETPLETVEQIPGVIKNIVEAQDNVRFDRSHFAKHGATALAFETVYFVTSPNYNHFMDIQQAINLRLHRELNNLSAEFAYPTQRLLLADADGSVLRSNGRGAEDDAATTERDKAERERGHSN